MLTRSQRLTLVTLVGISAAFVGLGAACFGPSGAALHALVGAALLWRQARAYRRGDA